MFSRQLIFAGHTRSFIITSSLTEGWEMRVEEDSRVLRRTRYTDWHRVERALASLEREVDALTAGGWRMMSEATSTAAQSTNR
jgi:hypothetical protein